MTAMRAVRRLVRLPLRLIPRSAVLRVIRGPLRGMRWIAGSAPHGAWLGGLETDKLRRFTQGLRLGMIVWDIGANVGLYSLASARAVGPSGTVYAFEPMPRNVNLLRRHIELNRVGNVLAIETAVGAASGLIRMAEGSSPSEFHIDSAGDYEVPIIALDTCVEQRGLDPPDVVKIDVEGAEADVLRGAEQTFSARRPVIWLALHGEQQRDACRRLLNTWGYCCEALDGKSLETSSEWLAQPEMNCVPSIMQVGLGRQ